MDASRLVVDYLNSREDIGAAAYYDVPSDRASLLPFVVVEQTGGGVQGRVVSTPDVDLDCWASTREGAAKLADSVIAAALEMPDMLPDVFGAEITSTYNNPDMETRPPGPRYTVGVSITYCS